MGFEAIFPDFQPPNSDDTARREAEARRLAVREELHEQLDDLGEGLAYYISVLTRSLPSAWEEIGPELVLDWHRAILNAFYGTSVVYESSIGEPESAEPEDPAH